MVLMTDRHQQTVRRNVDSFDRQAEFTKRSRLAQEYEQFAFDEMFYAFSFVMQLLRELGLLINLWVFGRLASRSRVIAPVSIPDFIGA